MNINIFIFLIYPALFILFSVAAWLSFYSSKKTKSESVKKKKERNIILYGRTAMLMWPLMFLTALILDFKEDGE
ncbi:hypothetical protein MYX07_00580 [Patescibacteria group bacterium AH-259-L07]|nr:hypothetical protein [Patescibacteria group bacterium AH-259-L07]